MFLGDTQTGKHKRAVADASADHWASSPESGHPLKIQ
jgi:hypothetical protein